MWEVQLRNLGGPNYMRFAPRIYDDEGREVPGNRGYRYFGRARELPGVKELFEAQTKPKKEEVREEIRRWVDAGYYGFGEEEEDELEVYERGVEEEARRRVEGKGGEAREGWSEIPEGWKVPSREEVGEFMLERRKQALLDKLG